LRLRPLSEIGFHDDGETHEYVRVSIAPRWSTAEVHAAVQAIDGTQDEVELMAGSLSFATPQELCGLRALVEHAAMHAERVSFDCPGDDQANRYLARMDFYSDLPPNVVLTRTVPMLRRNDRRQQLVELRRVACADDVEALMDRVAKVAEGHFGKGTTATACATALGAATENVIDHAQSPVGAWVAAQRYRRTGLELAVVDLGLGIPTTLGRNPVHAGLSDLDAVELALEDRVTSTGQDGRGAGLAELRTAVRQAGNSTLVIRSGRAHLTISQRGSEIQVQRFTPSPAVPGTWIAIRLQP